MSVVLVSKEGEKFVVSKSVGVMAELIQNVIENDPECTEDIPVGINSVPLKCFLEYCEHYNYTKDKTTIVHPLISTKPEEFITDVWERNFITKYD